MIPLVSDVPLGNKIGEMTTFFHDIHSGTINFGPVARTRQRPKVQTIWRLCQLSTGHVIFVASFHQGVPPEAGEKGGEVVPEVVPRVVPTSKTWHRPKLRWHKQTRT